MIKFRISKRRRKRRKMGNQREAKDRGLVDNIIK